MDADILYLDSRTMLSLLIWRTPQRVWATGEGFGEESNDERINVRFFHCWFRSEGINMCGYIHDGCNAFTGSLVPIWEDYEAGEV